MSRPSSKRTRVALVAALAAGMVVAILLGGCSWGPWQSAADRSAAQTGGLSTEPGRMSAEAKRSEIATSFPVEVPVPAGKVIRGEAQGDGAWDYQLMVPHSMVDVISWYAAAYTRAEWQFIADKEAGTGRKLVFIKNRAESEIIVKPAGARLTNVIGIVGVGAPVLNTQ